MSIRTADRAYEPDVDTRRVALASRLGSLADDVAIDIIRARANRLQLSESPSLREANELIKQVLAETRHPADAWTRTRNSGAVSWLMKLPVVSTPGVRASGEGDIRAFEILSEALQAACKNEATDEQLSDIRHYFDEVGTSMMHTARNALQSRS